LTKIPKGNKAVLDPRYFQKLEAEGEDKEYEKVFEKMMKGKIPKPRKTSKPKKEKPVPDILSMFSHNCSPKLL
jgi:uncharacterized membrane protein